MASRLPPPQALSTTELALAAAEDYEASVLGLSAVPDATRKSLAYRAINEWPEAGAASVLATFATNRQVYFAFLGMLANGVRVTTAARCVGILQSAVQEWLHKGAKHLGEKRASCYAWFYMDCFQARGASLVKAEMAAYQDDPIGFVKRMDAGGQFNELDPIGAEALFRLTETSLSTNSDDDALTGDDVYEMFKALNVKGALNLDACEAEANAQRVKKVEG